MNVALPRRRTTRKYSSRHYIRPSSQSTTISKCTNFHSRISSSLHNRLRRSTLPCTFVTTSSSTSSLYLNNCHNKQTTAASPQSNHNHNHLPSKPRPISPNKRALNSSNRPLPPSHPSPPPSPPSQPPPPPKRTPTVMNLQKTNPATTSQNPFHQHKKSRNHTAPSVKHIWRASHVVPASCHPATAADDSKWIV